MLKNKKVIIVGSGVKVTLPKTKPENVVIMAVNHGWLHCPDTFDIWFPASDFNGQTPTLNNTQIKVERYVKEIMRFGGFALCGYQVVLNAIYWAAAQRATAIGLVGCDMNYEPVEGKTHVYGIGQDVKAGEPDPLKAERVHGVSMTDLYNRAHQKVGVPLVNLSTIKKTALPIPRITPAKFFKL